MHAKKINLVLLLSLSLVVSCTKKPEEEPMVKKISEDTLRLSDEAIKNIKLEKVIYGEFSERLSLMGKISVPEDRVTVVPSRVTGRTDAVYVSSGEVVAAGTALASIFSADFVVAREEYLQSMEELKNNPSEESKKLLELSKRKLNALGVSASDSENWKSAKLDGKQGENIIIRAPRAGALIGKNAVVGNMVNYGDTLFMIGDMSKVWFAGDIYPEDLQRVKKGQEVMIEPAAGTPALHGQVSFISPVIDPTSRTIKIRALMDNPGNQLRGDMYVQGSVILSTKKALIAPKSALITLRGKIFCFKRQPGNTFKRVDVVADSPNGPLVSVTQGLQDGDEVVSEGGLLLDAGLNGAGT